MNHAGVYKIQSICKPDRFYIGSASNIKGRWAAHRSELKSGIHHSLKLQRHYNKYGEDDLVYLVLLECDDNREDLLAKEQFFIDSLNPYFNNCPLAVSRKGSKSSEETKEKIRKSLKGNKYSLGAKHTDEFCRKSRENRLKNWQDPVYRKKVSDGLKRSHAERGKNNASIKALLENSHLKYTPEAIKKKSENLKAAWVKRKHRKLHGNIDFESCPICNKPQSLMPSEQKIAS